MSSDALAGGERPPTAVPVAARKRSKRCAIGLAQIGVVSRPVTRVAPPPIGGSQHLLDLTLLYESAPKMNNLYDARMITNESRQFGVRRPVVGSADQSSLTAHLGGGRFLPSQPRSE